MIPPINRSFFFSAKASSLSDIIAGSSLESTVTLGLLRRVAKDLLFYKLWINSTTEKIRS